MVTVLKLGGSVITEKETPETVDEAALATAAASVGRHADGTDLVVVHGGGSFGHYHAERHGVSQTTGTNDAGALLEIHRTMGELTGAVLDALHAESVDALPVRPLSVAYRSDDGAVQFPAGHLGTMLDRGFTPVVNGDVIADAARGGTILGGDEIVVALARALDAQSVGLCSTVPGVLDDEGTVVPEVQQFADVADVVGGSAATDVTGGMAGKIRQLLDLDAPASVFDLDALDDFFADGAAGTIVR